MAETASIVRFYKGMVESAGEFVSDNPRILFDYWQRLRADRPRPMWREIDMMEIYTIAGFVVVKDLIADSDDFRIRYWGTGVTDHVGIEGTGKIDSELYAGTHRQHIREGFRMACNAGRPVRVVGQVTVIENKEHLIYEGVHLPLDGTAGTIAHLISAYTFGIELDEIPESS